MTVSPRSLPTVAVLAAAFWALASVMASATAFGPKDLVRALYAEPSLRFDGGKAQLYFSDDLGSSLKANGPVYGAISAVDFDFRYGPQDARVRGLQLLEEIDNDQARVVAVFKNYGRPESVDWTLCRRPDGDWRIADASSSTDRDAWDLRDMLRLAPGPVRC
jgi:hypothetical protein